MVDLANLRLAPTKAPSEDMPFLEGLGRSFVATFPELVGVPASQEVQKWRGENKAAAFASEIAAFSVPLMGWLKVAKGIPLMQKALVGVDTALPKAPIMAGAAKEIVRFAPFEALLAGGTVAAGGEVGEAATKAATATAAFGVFGAGAGLISAAGKRIVKARAKPGTNVSAPIQEQIGQLEAAIASGAVANPTAAEASIARLRHQVRAQAPKISSGERFVHSFDEGDSSKAVDRLFRSKKSQGRPHDTKRLVIGEKVDTFGTKAGLEGALARFGLEGMEAHIQTPRLLQPLRVGASRGIGAVIRRDLGSIDSGAGWFMRRDTGDGLFVMARRMSGEPRGAVKVLDAGLKKRLHLRKDGLYIGGIEENATLRRNAEAIQEHLSKGGVKKGFINQRGAFVEARPEAGPSQWLMFKTKDPGKFLPEQAKFSSQALEKSQVYGAFDSPHLPLSADPFAPSAVHDVAAKLRNTGAVDYRGLATERSTLAEFRKSLGQKLGVDKLGESQFTAGAKDLFRSTLVPAMFQFKKHPEHGWVFASAKQVAAAAEEQAERLFLGSRLKPTAGTSPGRAIFASTKAPADSINGMVDALFAAGPRAVAAFQKTAIANLAPKEGIEQFGLGRSGQRLLEKLNTTDKFMNDSVLGTIAATGSKALFRPKPFHYGMSRFWEGSIRVEIFEGGRRLGFIGGHNVKAAQQAAADLVAKQPGLRIGRTRTVRHVEDEVGLFSEIEEDAAHRFSTLVAEALPKGAPKRLVKVRKGARFFKGDLEAWTKNDVKEMVLKQLRGYQQFNAKISFEHHFRSKLESMVHADPATTEQLLLRIKSTFGVPGPVTEVLDRTLDVALAPVFGTESATKIAGALNKNMFRLTLGFLNSGFNMANAATFVQTAFPHIAMVAKAPAKELMPYYTFFPLQGIKRVDSFGMLDMAKVTARSFRRMAGKSDPELLSMTDRALAEGVISARFTEAWVGQKATNFVNLKDVFKGRESFPDFLGAMADILPTTTEKFARGHSFILGQTFFKEILGVKDKELLYQLSKRFVENTQFLYGTEDRARIMTGPLGATFGLFKNWMMHHLMWMGEYAGQGFRRGQWGPLMWTLGSTASMAGVAGLPMASLVNGAIEGASDKSAMLHLYENFGGDDALGKGLVADTLYWGLPAGLGFTLQNQTQAPFANFGSEAARFFNFPVLDRLKFLQKGAGRSIDNYIATGQGPASDPVSLQLFMRAFAPKNMYSSLQAFQGESLNSTTTGLPIMKDLPLSARLWHSAGVPPLELAKRYEVAKELWENQDAKKAATTRYGRAWAQAVQAGEGQEAHRIMLRSMQENVDVHSVLKSGKTFLRKGQEAQIERQFDLEASIPYFNAGIIRR